MDSLTDRYVDATLRRLPARQHTDIDRELRASIADAVEHRVDAGTAPAEAERATLTELGDPARLAAGYADRPLHLVGPAFYLDYTRLLTALLATMVPAVAIGVGVAQTAQGSTAGHAVGETVGAAVTTGVHIAVWTTLVFVVLERVPSLRWSPARTWSLASLPEPPGRLARRGELVAQAVVLVLLSTAVLLSPVLSRPVGILDPWLWHTGAVYVLVALATLGVGLSAAKRYARWSIALTVAASLVKLACALGVGWLAATGHVLNPAFVTPSGTPQWTDTGLIVTAVIGAGYTLVEAAVALTTRSWATPRLGARIRTVVDGVSGARTR